MSLDAELQDLVAGMGMAAQRHLPSTASAGMIMDGSYNPADGTVKVYIGSEMIQYDDNGDLIPLSSIPTYGPYPLLTPHIGQQGAPTGGERCYIIPVEGGALVAVAHFDDSPGIPAGEWKQLHPAHPNTNYHLKNDGSNNVLSDMQVIVNAPIVTLGETQSSGNDGVVRESDLQNAVNAVIQAVQDAFNSFAQTVQPGNGAAPPNVDSVQATASQITFSG